MSTEIIPVPHVGPCKTGALTGISHDEICKVLGFKPNCQDDTDKVRYSWGFEINGEPFGTIRVGGNIKNGPPMETKLS